MIRITYLARYPVVQEAFGWLCQASQVDSGHINREAVQALTHTMTYGRISKFGSGIQPRPDPGKHPAAVPRTGTTAPDTAADEPMDKESSKGFDPYNSGAFDKRQTWIRVIRK